MNDKHPKILIIDDKPTNLLTLAAVLYKEFDLRIAESGQAGLDLARQDRPDIVLLDVMMPDMDGYETCRRFRADPKLRTIPIIFVTAMNETNNEYLGLALGAVDYLVKPLNVKITRQRIRNILEREQLRKEVECCRDKLKRQLETQPSAS